MNLTLFHNQGRGKPIGGSGKYTSNFDEGSGAIDAATGRITPVAHWNNQWLWWCFKHSKLGGQTPTYLIAKANRFAAPAANENLGVWAQAADTDTWNKFTTQSVGASDISLQHGSAFPAGPIYISYIPMYPWSRIVRKVTEWLANAYVSDATSETDGVISLSTSRDAGDGSGRTVAALPFYGFKLTNATGGTKNKAILTARAHPNETQGSFQLEGAITWLLGGTPEAEFLLDYFEFYIYPCLNPQGVWSGYFRSSPETPASDNNRLWDGTGVNEAVDAFKTAMNADTSGAIEVGIDFHGANATTATGYIDAEDHTAALYAVFIAKMTGYDAAFGYVDETVTTMLRYLWQHTYNAPLAIIVEAMDLTSMDFPAVWKTQGQNSMKALSTMEAEGRFTQGPGVGSRNMNGTTDRIDWANVANLAGQALTISFWINLDAVAHNSYIFCDHNAGDAAYGLIMNCPGNTAINFTRRGTSDYIWGANSLPALEGAWHHILSTSDGGLVSGSAATYLDGVSKTITFTNGTGAETAHTGSWSIGGRIYDDARNADGKIAQVAVWNRVLTPAEIANLTAGYAPDLAAPSGLVFYFKGNTASLTAAPGGDGTADGTSSVTGVGNGPSIIYG